MVTTLITVAAIAWLTQLAFGGWQIRRFNRAFDSLCQQGRLASAVPPGALNHARLSLSPSMKTIVFAIRC